MRKARFRTTRSGKHRSFTVPLIIAAGVLLLAVGGWLAFRPRAPQVPIEVSGAPSLRAEPSSLDFGDVRLGETVTAVFELSNAGDQALEFTRLPYVEVVEGC